MFPWMVSLFLHLRDQYSLNLCLLTLWTRNIYFPPFLNKLSYGEAASGSLPVVFLTFLLRKIILFCGCGGCGR